MSTTKRASRKRLSEVTPIKSAGATVTPRTPRIVYYNAENEPSPKPLNLDDIKEDEEAGTSKAAKKKTTRSPKLKKATSTDEKTSVVTTSSTPENHIALSPPKLVSEPSSPQVIIPNGYNRTPPSSYNEKPEVIEEEVIKRPLHEDSSWVSLSYWIKSTGWALISLCYSITALIILCDIHLLSRHSKRRSTIISTLLVIILLFGLSGLMTGDSHAHRTLPPVTYEGDLPEIMQSIDERITSNIEALRDEITKDKEAITRLSIELEKSKSREQTQTSGVTKLTGRMDQLEQELRTLIRDLDTQIAAIGNRFEPIDLQMKTTEGFKHEITNIMDQVRKLTSSNAENREEYVLLKNQLDDLSSRVSKSTQDESQKAEALITKLKDWVKLHFASKDDLEVIKVLPSAGTSKEELEAILKNMPKSISNDTIKGWIADYFDQITSSRKGQEITKEKVQQWIREVVEELRKKESSSWFRSGSSDVSREEVAELINTMLDKHDADRIGLTDYALYSAGAVIENSFTSPSFYKTVDQSWGGYFAGLLSRKRYGAPPQVVIQPDNTPGNCWAFAGTVGNITIRLAQAIIPEKFSLDHISPSVAFNIDTAPKKCSVWGYNVRGFRWDHLADFEYDINGKQVQTFDSKKVTDPYTHITLGVLSNYGFDEYTCIYRFRVHGTPSQL